MKESRLAWELGETDFKVASIAARENVTRMLSGPGGESGWVGVTTPQTHSMEVW